MRSMLPSGMESRTQAASAPMTRSGLRESSRTGSFTGPGLLIVFVVELIEFFSARCDVGVDDSRSRSYLTEDLIRELGVHREDH